MNYHLTRILAIFLFSLPCAAGATTALSISQPGKLTALQAAETSPPQIRLDSLTGNLDPVLRRGKPCNNIANCQVVRPWAKNPFRNRIYLVRDASQNPIKGES